MEDKKRKKDDKRKRETSQKVVDQKNKVPDLTKPTSAQSPATQSSSASPSPGPTPSASPLPGTPGSGSAAPSQGGNNAKRLLVANGQPASTSSSSSTTGGLSATGNGTSSSGSGAQTPQQQPRYMPREVPPRFRCQQDHKVLLKRGQPPLSSMLLGGGGGDSPIANLAVSDSGAAVSSLALTSSSVAASTTTTSNYANSMWGVSSGSQASSQGREKVIVDGNDLEEWPSIAGSEGGGSGGGSSNNNNNGMSVNSTSASGNQPSPTSSLSLPNECMQSSSGVAWGTAASQGHLGGGSTVAVSGSSSLSKASTVPGSHDASGPMEGSSGIPGANLNPNANPSAWPALVQQDGPAASGEGGPSSFSHQGPGGPMSANNSAPLGLGAGALGMLGGPSPLPVNQSNAHQHQLHQMQSRDGKWDSELTGPNTAGEGAGGVMERSGIGGDHNLGSSWRSQPSFSASNSKAGAARTDGWDTGSGAGMLVAAEGDNGTSGWGYPGSTSGANAWGNVGGNVSQTSGVSQGGWGSEREVPSSEWGGGEDQPSRVRLQAGGEQGQGRAKKPKGGEMKSGEIPDREMEEDGVILVNRVSHRGAVAGEKVRRKKGQVVGKSWEGMHVTVGGDRGKKQGQVETGGSKNANQTEVDGRVRGKMGQETQVGMRVGVVGEAGMKAPPEELGEQVGPVVEVVLEVEWES
uniref:Trinucleotide repeat containing 6B n=1 Tax=Knipowitschia caucasica TaxID=637954 RepID=A0AAV2LUU4_KNICA